MPTKQQEDLFSSETTHDMVNVRVVASVDEKEVKNNNDNEEPKRRTRTAQQISTSIVTFDGSTLPFETKDAAVYGNVEDSFTDVLLPPPSPRSSRYL